MWAIKRTPFWVLVLIEIRPKIVPEVPTSNLRTILHLTFWRHSAAGSVSRASSDPRPTLHRSRHLRSHCNFDLRFMFGRPTDKTPAKPGSFAVRSSTTPVSGAMPCWVFAVSTQPCKWNSATKVSAFRNTARSHAEDGCRTPATPVELSICPYQSFSRLRRCLRSESHCGHFCSRNAKAGSTDGCVSTNIAVSTFAKPFGMSDLIAARRR